MSIYYVYLIRCSDQTFYTGICTNLSRRLKEHSETNKGARYTRYRRPVHLVYQESYPDRSQAQKREYRLRHLTHQQKEDLATNFRDCPPIASPPHDPMTPPG